MLVINDLHIAATRVAGTTPTSAAALKKFTLDSFESFMLGANEPVLIAGDLFDVWQAGLSDVLRTYQILKAWLTKGHKLVVMAANHDLSTDSSKFGSLQFLMALLSDEPNVQFVIHAGAWVAEGMYCVPHVANSDLFDMELAKVPECEVLFLHANLDNPWACSSDHSLNVTREQLDKLPAKLVYFGHEHHARRLGKAFVGGVQWPTSVSDCLDKKDKFAYRITGTVVEPIKTWDSTNYAEIDWRNPEASDAQFIRFVGHCKPDEAAEMANVIAAYRRSSDAFVITNAVKVGEDTEGAELELASLEAINKFNVMDALKEYLSVEDVKILESLNA